MSTEEGEVGFEEGMSWLPSHVLHEACDVKVELRHQEQQSRYHQLHHRRPAFSAELPPLMRSKYNSRTGVSPNRATGGPGMQAIFIKSGGRSSGTGVFLPSKPGSNLHANKKPACSSILLPAHVVEALNLNGHALGLGLNLSTTEDRKRDTGGISLKNQSGENVDVCCILTHSKNSSAEIYLPKEWSY